MSQLNVVENSWGTRSRGGGGRVGRDLLFSMLVASFLGFGHRFVLYRAVFSKGLAPLHRPNIDVEASLKAQEQALRSGRFTGHSRVGLPLV